MKKQINLLYLSLLLTSFCFSQSLNDKLEYPRILSEILSITPNSVATVPPQGISIQKDVALFEMQKGEIYRFTKVRGREVLLFFKGDGRFTFTPPTKVERDHLFRFYETPSLDEKFDYLFILFTDTTNLDVLKELEFNSFDNFKVLKKDLKYCFDYITDTDKGYFYTDFMTSMLEDETNAFFYAQIGFDLKDPFFFEISPFQDEEVSFGSKRDVINQFHLISEYSSGLQKEVKQTLIKINDYIINSNIATGLDFSAECDVNFVRNDLRYNWLKFSMYSELSIDSIYLNGKKTENYYRGKENPELWIKLDSMVNVGSDNSIKLFYHGELLEKNELGWVALKSSSSWYPRYSYRDNCNFDLTFKYPENYKLVSIGKKISEEESDDFIISKWKTIEPGHNASFNIGHFDNYDFRDESENKVNVLISKQGHQLLSGSLAAYGMLSGADMEEKIGTDILACVQFYEGMFGPVPLKELNVTEIPYYHGEAFPGLVHLSWANYQGIEYDKAGELFRAHEVAHQWWGIGVDFDSYHDQWLSEGFSEYSAAWFVQAAFEGNDAFFDILDEWKENILSNRKYLFSDGQQAGPIWLGHRTNSSETLGDYDLIIYKKGAWVLHMLRNMLLDLKTMNEDAFKNMIREYYKTYYGKKATTEDFKRIVDKYFGEDMKWFFDQYVYGTEIPTYKFSYKTENSPDGKVITTCKVVQENVSGKFKMYVPVKLVFSGERFARLRFEIKDKESVIKLPPLPEEPEQIIFNDLNSVLCEVDYDDWE